MRLSIAIIFSLSIYVSAAGQQRITYSGYTKDLISAIHIKGSSTYWDNLLHNRAMFDWQLDTALTIRADIRTRLFYGDQPRTTGFNEAIERAANDVLDLSVGTDIGSNAYVHSYLDRLYLQYVRNKLELRVGRQRINWGINTLWNPNDIFNAYAFTDFDYEERPGSDAITIRYFTGELSSIEVAGKLGNDFQDGAMAALWRTHTGQYDLQFLGGYLTESQYIVVGGGWAGNLKNWGFKGEGSVFVPTKDTATTGGAVSIGLDYIFPSGLLIGFGGLYNAQGRTSGGLDDLFAFELSAQNLYPYRWTVNATAGFALHPLVNCALTGVYSIVSAHPVFLSPAVTWSAAENLDVDLVGQIVMQKLNNTYRSPIQAGFLRVKWSY